MVDSPSRDSPDRIPAETTVQLGHALIGFESAYRDLWTAMAADLGVSVLELNALLAVSRSSEYTPKMLSNEVAITAGSITALVDRLERAGYLTRARNPADRGSVFLALTPRGVDLLQEVARRHEDAVIGMHEVSPHFLDPDVVEDITRAIAVLAVRTYLDAFFQRTPPQAALTRSSRGCPRQHPGVPHL